MSWSVAAVCDECGAPIEILHDCPPLRLVERQVDEVRAERTERDAELEAEEEEHDA